MADDLPGAPKQQRQACDDIGIAHHREILDGKAREPLPRHGLSADPGEAETGLFFQPLHQRAAYAVARCLPGQDEGLAIVHPDAHDRDARAVGGGINSSRSISSVRPASTTIPTIPAAVAW